MTNPKRLLAVLLMIMMLAVCFAPRALAEAEMITPGWTQTLTLQPGEKLEFSFTPEKDGKYILAQKSDKLTLGLETEGDSSASAWVSGRYRGYVYTMYAGTAYTITVSLPSWHSEPCTAQVHFEENRSIEGASLDRTDLTGSVGERYRLNLNIAPAYDGWQVTWASSDPAVVTFEKEDATGCTLRLLSEGTATVTATVEGLTVSCAVTVGKMAQWGEETAKTVTLMPGGCRVYAFTPAESGEYVLYQGADILDLDITQNGAAIEKSHWSVGDTHGYRCYLESGVTYIVSLGMWQGYMDSQWADGFTGTILLEKAEKTQSITIDQQQVVGYEGHRQSLLAITNPVYGMVEGVSWSSSDPEVADIAYSSAGYCEVNLNKAGSATITATTTSGLSATCTVIVKSTPTLTLDQTAKLELLDDANVHCHFTPGVSGYYQFWMTTDAAILAQLFTQQGDYAATLKEGGEKVLTVYLEAGETCWLELSGNSSGNVQVLVSEANAITQLKIQKLPTQLSFVKDQFDAWAADPLEGLQLQVFWADGQVTDYVYDSNTNLGGHPLQSSLNVHKDGLGGTVTVTCGGASVSYDVEFVDNPVVSLEVVGQQAVPLLEGVYYTENYGFLYYDYAFALQGIQLKVRYSDGAEEIVDWNVSCLNGYCVDVSTQQGAVIWTPGEENKVTFHYLGQKAELCLTMTKPTVQRIELNSVTAPEYLFGAVSSGNMKASCSYGFAPNLVELAKTVSITVYFSDGTSKLVTYEDCGGYPLEVTLSDDTRQINEILLEEPGTVSASVYYMGCYAPFTLEVKEEADHSLIYVPAKSATFYGPGNTAYYMCRKCGRFFSDDLGTQEILDRSSVVLPQLRLPGLDNPPTGDYRPIIPVALLLILSATGLVLMIILVKRSKDND